MSGTDDRKTLAERALQNMEYFVNHADSEHAARPKLTVLDKHEFVLLLKNNFDKLDKDRSDGISRAEIAAALTQIADYSANEFIMLELLVRYFDFIAELVDDNAGVEKVISRADVDALGQFLLGSDMTLEALYMWCSGPKGPPKADIIKPPPLTGGP